MDTITHNELQAKNLYQYTKEGKLIMVWSSISKASKELGIDRPNIIAVCSGRRKSYKNFYWSYSALTFSFKDGKVVPNL
jgi:hypothetical protein